MDPTALYYTFSTIAQALAGALAVLVAFVLFKLSDLDRAIQLAQYELQGQYQDWPRLWEILKVGGLEVLEEELAHPVQQPRLRAAYHEGNIAWRLRPRILRTLFYALIASVVDIAVCFAALPWTPTLATARLAIPLVVVTVSLGITCLALYVWLIMIVVERPEPLPPTAK